MVDAATTVPAVASEAQKARHGESTVILVPTVLRTLDPNDTVYSRQPD